MQKTKILFLCLFMISGNALAQYEEEFERWSVDIERYDLDLRADNGPAFDTTFTFVGAQAWQGFGEHVSGGLRGGFADFDQDSNPLYTGLSPSNFFLGFGFDVHGLRDRKFSPLLRAYFDYVDFDDSNDARQVHVDFFSLTLKIGARVKIGRVLWRFGGVGYAIDGDEEFTGDLMLKRDLKTDKSGGVFTELEFPLGVDGSFAIGAESGARRGWLISFAKEF